MRDSYSVSKRKHTLQMKCLEQQRAVRQGDSQKSASLLPHSNGLGFRVRV